ncbi:MAG TPA: MFS transporter [Nitrososphaera sp.]|nr:MFS transporter [Nitrososphaera sp.]
MGTFEEKDKAEGPVKIPSSAWKVLAVLSSIATMVMYAETMLIPAIPDLIREFNVSYSMSSWILTAYLIPGAVMTPIAGKLSDIYGKKKVLLTIMATYIAGITIAGLSTDIYMLFAARAIQGIGMAMFVIAFGIIRDQFPREKLSIGQGVISSMFASGAVIGLLVGGVIISNYGWHATFLSTIPIAIALFVIIWRFDYERRKESGERVEQVQAPSADLPKSVDIKGAVALAVFVTCFLLALTLLETGIEDDARAIGQIGVFLAAGVASLILFIPIERRARAPIVDFKLMSHRAILPANLIIMIVGFSMFMVFQTIPVLVRNPEPLGFGGDAAMAGFVQLPFAIVLLVFGPTSGFIVEKLGSIKSVIIGTSITTIGFTSLFAFHNDSLSVAANLAVLSTGLSLTNVGALNVTLLATPLQFTGMSLGMNTLLRIIGASIGPALAGVYMQLYQSSILVSGIPVFYPSMQAYQAIFLSAAVLSVLSIVLAIYLRRKLASMSIPNLR